mmetsp:Transcript_19979/g.31816  ORF Transcript_19979/g.31816 Transcript_19979/m.31816 type:complete len:213 (-) Transcript_19979:865-1503(-)
MQHQIAIVALHFIHHKYKLANGGQKIIPQRMKIASIVIQQYIHIMQPQLKYERQQFQSQIVRILFIAAAMQLLTHLFIVLDSEFVHSNAFVFDFGQLQQQRKQHRLEQKFKRLHKRVFVADFDGILQQRFMQTIDGKSARNIIAIRAKRRDIGQGFMPHLRQHRLILMTNQNQSRMDRQDHLNHARIMHGRLNRVLTKRGQHMQHIIEICDF